jgi:hypothetical protein
VRDAAKVLAIVLIPVSVVVSVGSTICCVTVHGAARIVSHGRSVNTDVFAVLQFVAGCCLPPKTALKATRITGPYSPPLGHISLCEDGGGGNR